MVVVHKCVIFEAPCFKIGVQMSNLLIYTTKFLLLCFSQAKASRDHPDCEGVGVWQRSPFLTKIFSKNFILLPVSRQQSTVFAPLLRGLLYNKKRMVMP